MRAVCFYLLVKELRNEKQVEKFLLKGFYSWIEFLVGSVYKDAIKFLMKKKIEIDF